MSLKATFKGVPTQTQTTPQAEGRQEVNLLLSFLGGFGLTEGITRFIGALGREQEFALGVLLAALGAATLATSLTP